MGPCASSVFIRECKNCKLVLTPKQFRMRDCKNLIISLYTQTEPVIEASEKITFVPHQYVYPEMFQQMKEANLSLWNNKYSEVFDFSPAANGKPNYSVKIKQDPDTAVEWVDLHSFEKIINKFENKHNKRVTNLNDLDAIFGDASFYKETEEREKDDDELEPQ